MNFGFGAADSSDVVGSEHEQHESGLRVPVARLVMLASHCQRSGALRSRDGLGSASSISESAAACGLDRSEVDGSPGERVALAAAMRAANWHAPFLRRQLSHFWSFAASRRHFPSLAGALHRREAPFAPRGLPARGPAPHAGHNRNAGRQSGLMRSHIPKIGRQAPVTLRYSDHECRRCIQDFPVQQCFFRYSGTISRRSTERNNGVGFSLMKTMSSNKARQCSCE